MQRIASVARISFASSTAFATLGTALTTLVITPLFSVLYDIVFGQDLRAPDYTRIGYAAALVALCLSVEAGITSKAVTDRNLGVFEEIHMRRSVDTAYWVGSSIIPLLLSTLTAAVTIAGVFAFSAGHDPHMVIKVIMLCPATMLMGMLLGVCCAGVGVSLPDPYLADTILDAILPLSAGVIVPTTLYPDWLRALFHLLPMTGTLTVLTDNSTGNIGRPLCTDILLAVVWACVGLVFVRVAVSNLRNGKRRDVI
ncbi:MAG: ABC transporter permease [Bifidobacterium sp.]|jgi:ABC-2 type transport system permease protein|nr:ABC transporter permease [Bifidobacterium sp.]